MVRDSLLLCVAFCSILHEDVFGVRIDGRCFLTLSASVRPLRYTLSSGRVETFVFTITWRIVKQTPYYQLVAGPRGVQEQRTLRSVAVPAMDSAVLLPALVLNVVAEVIHVQVLFR